MKDKDVIPAFLTRNQITTGLLFYVRGVQSALPTVSTAQAVQMFCERYNPPFTAKSGEVVYGRICKDLTIFKPNFHTKKQSDE